jgi:diguanylate cyclase (GGDEF)-like protein
VRTLNKPVRSGESAPDDDGTELMVLDAGGRVFLGNGIGGLPLSRVTLSDMINRKQGAFTARTDAGGMVTGYAFTAGFGEFPGLGWTVIARRPAAQAFVHASEVAWTITLLGLAMGVIGIIVASLLAGRIARPLRRLTETADQIGRDSTDMLPRVRGSPEVVRLSSALRSLMVRLGFAERRSLEAEMRAQDEAKKFSHDIAALRALADTDILTRLFNRRSCMGFAADALVHYARYKRPFAILMIDIDHFKRVNDNYGHVGGDTAIRYVASIIASLVRPSDKAARFGGEEFVVLLREVSLDSAETIAERLRTMVGRNPVRFNGFDIPITVSIGVAVVDDDDRDVQDVIERADLALYAAKSSGRNVVLTRPVAPIRQRLSA